MFMFALYVDGEVHAVGDIASVVRSLENLQKDDKYKGKSYYIRKVEDKLLEKGVIE